MPDAEYMTPELVITLRPARRELERWAELAEAEGLSVAEWLHAIAARAGSEAARAP